MPTYRFHRDPFRESRGVHALLSEVESLRAEVERLRAHLQAEVKERNDALAEARTTYSELNAEYERLRYVAEAAQVVVRFPSDLNVAILNARLNEVGLEAAMSQRVERYEKSLGNDKEC